MRRLRGAETDIDVLLQPCHYRRNQPACNSVQADVTAGYAHRPGLIDRVAANYVAAVISYPLEAISGACFARSEVEKPLVRRGRMAHLVR